MFKIQLRNHEIYLLREQGISTIQLSKIHSLSKGRIHEIHHKIKNRIKRGIYHDPTSEDFTWLNGLSDRVACRLLSHKFKSKNAVKSVMIDGVLPSLYMIGKQSRDSIYRWLELPNLDEKSLDSKISKAIKLLESNDYKVLRNV